MLLLTIEIIQNVQDRPLGLFQPQLFHMGIIKIEGRRLGFQQEVNSFIGFLLHLFFLLRHVTSPNLLFNSSISFLSSIIFSSRPTVSLWNRSSSARRSSSLVLCSATWASAFF